MRILVHDFGGYAFPLQLSQALSARGHTVCHAYCASHQTTPPGIEQATAKDQLEVLPLHLRQPLNKYALTTRWRQEREYGRIVTDAYSAFQPTVLLSGNTPLNAQHHLMKACRAANTPVIYWLQDLIGEATQRLLSKRLGLVGTLAGRYFQGMERRLLKRSAAVVTISEDFVPHVTSMGVARSRIHIIENWAPLHAALSDLDPPSLAQKLAASPTLLYTGTLSMKHNPALLADLAETMRGQAQVVVISQGMGANWLKGQKNVRNLSALTVLPYQPRKDLPALYASATVLVAVLEEDASVFSVPSKVLTYLAAGKPLLLAVPSTNLAARIVTDAQAGYVVSPRDPNAFRRKAQDLLQDHTGRDRMGQAARSYAEKTFCIDRITNRFLDVIACAIK